MATSRCQPCRVPGSVADCMLQTEGEPAGLPHKAVPSFSAAEPSLSPSMKSRFVEAKLEPSQQSSEEGPKSLVGVSLALLVVLPAQSPHRTASDQVETLL